MPKLLNTTKTWSVDFLYDSRLMTRSRCFGKKSWNYPEAKNIAERYSDRVALQFGNFSAYYCHEHESWHVGHRGKRDALLKSMDSMIMEA